MSLTPLGPGIPHSHLNRSSVPSGLLLGFAKNPACSRAQCEQKKKKKRNSQHVSLKSANRVVTTPRLALLHQTSLCDACHAGWFLMTLSFARSFTQQKKRGKKKRNSKKPLIMGTASEQVPRQPILNCTSEHIKLFYVLLFLRNQFFFYFHTFVVVIFFCESFFQEAKNNLCQTCGSSLLVATGSATARWSR